ncbi:MAG: hypothetical protein ACR2N0_14510 [Rubrobacteraceae bacterium]
MPTFPDTNVPVYAVDEEDRDKYERASEVVEERPVDGDGFL